MIIIRAILLLLHFTLVPVALGQLITYNTRDDIHKNPIVKYMIGMFSSWGIFYVIFAIVEWHQNWNTFTDPYLGCFSVLVRIYSVVITALVVLSIVLNRKSICFKLPEIKLNRFLAVYIAIFAAILLVQCYFAYKYQINQWSYDDYDYVVGSLDNITHDSINYTNITTGDMPYTVSKRSSASWTTFISYLAATSGFEVTTICHTIFPVLLMMIAYMTYFYFSKQIFAELENRMIFMILLAVLFAFGMYSHYSVTFRLLCAIWQGKGVLSAIVIPFLLAYLIDLYKTKPDRRNLLPIAVVSIGMCSLTAMATFIVISIQVLMWVITSMSNRKANNPAYLLAGMVGPVLQIIFYTFIYLLLVDAAGIEDIFKNR